MDRDVVTAKLESLRRCVERVRSRTPASVEELSSSCDAQDILCLNLERAVQACVDIAAHIVSDSECAVPDTMAGTFDALERQGLLSRALARRMRRAVGFRNISVQGLSDPRLGDCLLDCDETARRFRRVRTGHRGGVEQRGRVRAVGVTRTWQTRSGFKRLIDWNRSAQPRRTHACPRGIEPTTATRPGARPDSEQLLGMDSYSTALWAPSSQ